MRPHRMSPWKPCLATLLLAAALASCGKVPSTDGAPAAPVTVETTCPAGLTPLGSTEMRGSAVPDNFATAWVLRCRSDLRDLPGQGRWQVLLAERADTPAAELVAALRKPSDPRTADACTMELVTVPYFVLVDANGTAILPAVPTDACGKPHREALAQLEKLTFRTLSETPVNQVESPKAVESGCSESWKDELAILGRNAVKQQPQPVSIPSDLVKVCVYDSVGGGDTPVGKLNKAHTIDGDAAKALAAALKKAGPAEVCSAPHTKFATLFSTVLPLPGSWGTAALDGCRQLLLPMNVRLQLDDQLVAMLAG